MKRDGGLVRPSQSQEVERMDQRWKYNFIIHILLSIMTVLAAAALFLFYENWLAEDMIRELNRDYEELLRERGAGSGGE